MRSDGRHLRDYEHLVVVEEGLHVFAQRVDVQEEPVGDVQFAHGWRFAHTWGRGFAQGVRCVEFALLGLDELAKFILGEEGFQF